MRTRILLSAAALAIAMLVGFAAFECRAVYERETISEVRGRLGEALPEGSSRDEIRRYLEAQHIPYDQLVVSEGSAQTTTFQTAAVAAGTSVILSVIYQDGTLVWLGPRELHVVFVLDDESTLERVSIVPYEVE